jgi:PAS domain S-box-containing protein
MREWNDADDSSKWSRFAPGNLCAANGWRAFAVHTSAPSTISAVLHEFTTSAGCLFRFRKIPPLSGCSKRSLTTRVDCILRAFGDDNHEFLPASRDANAKLDALSRSQAVIEFNLDGTIITANANFLNAMGYTLEEIRGKHHSMFVDKERRDNAEYREFWDSLRRGEYQAREFKRVAKGGRTVWIQASYNPLMNARGKPYKVVKFAADITMQKLRNADCEGQLKAIHKSQAVIEFNPDGSIITANDNFLKTVGYSLDEIQGHHHRMFVEPDERDSVAYQVFWDIAPAR